MSALLFSSSSSALLRSYVSDSLLRFARFRSWSFSPVLFHPYVSVSSPRTPGPRSKYTATASAPVAAPSSFFWGGGSWVDILAQYASMVQFGPPTVSKDTIARLSTVSLYSGGAAASRGCGYTHAGMFRTQVQDTIKRMYTASAPSPDPKFLVLLLLLFLIFPIRFRALQCRFHAPAPIPRSPGSFLCFLMICPLRHSFSHFACSSS